MSAPSPGKHPRRQESSRTAQPSRAAQPCRAAPPCRPALPSRTAVHCPTASAPTVATAPFAATAATLATASTAAMASPTVLTFDAEGRAVDFDMWVDDLQLFLQCDSRDGVSLFYHTSGVSTAPTASATSTVRSQWTTRDAVARLAVRSHLPPAEHAHFGQYKTAQSLYDAVVARYSSPATAALSRLMLPYLFPDLAAFATVADLVAHLRTSDARYCAALPTEFCAKNPPPMYITLYYLVTRLRDSLSSVRDHLLSLCPTELTVNLLEERLTAAEKSILAVVGDAATAGARGARVVEGAAGEAVEEVVEAEGEALVVGVVPRVGASVVAEEVVEAAAEVEEAEAAMVEVAAVVVLVEVQPRSVEALVVASASSSHTPVRLRRSSSFFPDAVELPRWHDLLLQNVPIFDLDFDAILAAMYAIADSVEGDCYLCVPPDPGIAAAALGASAAAALGASASAAPGLRGRGRRGGRGGRRGRGRRGGRGGRGRRGRRGGRRVRGRRGGHRARAASGGALGVPLWREPLSPQLLHEWYSRHCQGTAGATGGAAGACAAGGAAGAAGAGGAGGAAGAGAAGGAGGAAGAGASGGAAGAGSSEGAASAGAAGAGATGSARGATGAGAARGASRTGDPGAGGTGSDSSVCGGVVRPQPPLPVQSQSRFQPASPLPGPSPYSGPTRGLTERPEPESRPVSPESRSASPRIPLPSPPASSLPAGQDLASDSLRAASPVVARFLANVVTDPLFESIAASALVTELVDFAAGCRLDYATSLVVASASASVCPPSVGGECVLSMDVLEDRQEEFECFAASVPHLVSMLIAHEGDSDAPDIPAPRSYVEAIEGPYYSQWQAAMDAEMASWRSTGTYVDKVPPPGANIVSGMWIFRGVDFFHTFSPTSKMTTLRVLLHVAALHDYELHSLNFSTAFLQGSLYEETQWSLRRPVYSLRQAPREWHDTLRLTLDSLGFAPSIADLSLFLRTDTTLPPFYVLVYVDNLVFATADTEALAHVKSELQKRHKCPDLGEQTSHLGLRITRDRAQRTITLTQSHMVLQVLQRFGFTYSSPQSTPLPSGHLLSAPPSDESVEPSGPYPELVGCLMYLMTCTRPDLAYPFSLLARYVAPGRHRKGYTFSLGSGSIPWQSTRSSSILNSSCEAEIYAGAMAAEELRWLTYLLIDLGEAPRSPPVLYINNKAMLALCQEHRLEHKTKHIALRYFLARELQQRGQLCLAYVASQANTADVFTKALQPCDHQPCFAFLDWSCDLLFSPTLPMGVSDMYPPAF
ncbi:unnamed protein product [Closterium sp. NIES-53]